MEKFLTLMLLYEQSGSVQKLSSWITSELKKRMHERDIMKLKAVRSKSPQDWGEFKRLRNEDNSNIRIRKEILLQTIIY